MIDMETSLFDLPMWIYISALALAVTATIFTLTSKKLPSNLRLYCVIQAWIMPFLGPLAVLGLIIAFPKHSKE